jgi:DNA polymerase elongation subunit (family B)
VDAGPSDDALLYGHDGAERIVALHPVGPGGTTMRLYRRRSPTEVVTEDVRVHPFFFLSDIDLLRGFPRDRFQFQVLEGDAFFRHVVAFPDRSSYFDALRHVERATDTEKQRPDEVYLPGSPEQQYLMQTGRTLFKGMAFEDLVRLQLDIEVYSPAGFPQASVPEHRIILVALSDSTGWSRLVGAPGMTEEEVLRETLDLVKERDPDVIEGHNITGFDFPYLFERCRRWGVPLDLGRDGSPPRTYPTSMRFAERSVEFEAVEIAGRHTIDTLHQVMAFDVFKRDLPNYTLKGAARYFGFAPPDRTYVPGDQIAEVWDTDPHRLMEYAVDDATETERLARHLSGSTFYLTQMVPMPYGQAARTGPAAKVEALFVRGYLHARHSLPRADFGSQVVGGYTDVFVTGVVGPVVYADVESLYPSIMLNYDVQPKDDALGLFPRLLQRLTDLRFETKDAMRDARGDERGGLDARRSAYKIVINCFTPDTDVMTADGLRPIGGVAVGDLVYSLDPETMTATYKPVTRTYRQERYAGPLVYAENGFVDLAVTPNHRLLTEAAPGGRPASGYEWREASDLFASKHRHRLPPGAPLQADRRHAFVLSEACDRLGVAYLYDAETDRAKDPRQQAKWVPNTYRLTDWLQLCGWYVSEGDVSVTTRKDYGYTVRGESWRVQIANKTPPERDEIGALLSSMGLHGSESVNGFVVANKLIAEVLAADFGNGSAEKRLPRWVWTLDGLVLRNLLRTAYLGDGNKRQGRYTTQSRRLAEDFVRLAFHCGKRARIAGHDSGCWRVAYYDRSRGVRPEIKAEHRRTEPYDGPVVCVEVADTHTVLAGRDGKLNWVGQSFYGNMGFGYALFNDFAEADRVAATGQDLLRQIMRLARSAGAKVVEVDTDGVLFVPPPGVEGEEAERRFVQGLSEQMPEGIRIGFDGRFRRMLSYKKKNYALLGYDGALKFKGSSLVSRSSERFGRAFVREAIRLLLEEDVQGVHDLYLRHRQQVQAHDWRGVESFQRVETLKASLADYERAVANGDRNRTAAYEVAKLVAERTGRAPRIGDRIAYYIAEGGGRVFESARPAADWDAEAPDEDTAFYLDRLDQLAGRFEPFFETPSQFRLVFSEEDLFGFDASAVRLVVRERDPEEVEDDVPF